MIIEWQQVGRRAYDLAIVGAGPAGIILALEYARLRPASAILLLEYGSMTATATNGLDDSIDIPNLVNHRPPYDCTNKGLGGTSMTWGGRCVMFDPIDFVDRPILQGECTWDPTLLEELRPHTKRTSHYFRCGEGGFDLAELPGAYPGPIAEGFIAGPVTDTRIERWSPPVRFGRDHRHELSRSEVIDVLLDAEAMELPEPDDTGFVRSLLIRNRRSGTDTTVHAAAIAICAGAQESTRLLLRSPRLFHACGGPPAALGHYYQGHVNGNIASVVFSGDPRRTDYTFRREADGTYIRRRIQFTDEFLLRSDLLNVAIWLDNPPYSDPDHRNGALSFIYMAMIAPLIGRRLAPPAIAHSITARHGSRRISAHARNIIRDMPGSVLTPASIFARRYLPARKLPGVMIHNRRNTYALHFHSEQTSEYDNRIDLNPDGRRLTIHYAINERDVDSVIRAHRELDRWLRQTGAGRLEFWHSDDKLGDAIRAGSLDGVHQSGTTRIADSADRGVVDRDLRVFGTQNVYVCSSSAFPTSGQANPTYLLGVFAVRLGNHLSAA